MSPTTHDPAWGSSMSMPKSEFWILMLLYGSFIFACWAIAWTLDEEIIKEIPREFKRWFRIGR